MQNKEQLKDGIYKSDNATYFVKGNKIIMRLMGSYYKTSDNFLIGVRWEKPFDISQENFDKEYEKLKSW